MFLVDFNVNRTNYGAQFIRDEITLTLTLVGPAEQFEGLMKHLQASLTKDVNLFLIEPIVKGSGGSNVKA